MRADTLTGRKLTDQNGYVITSVHEPTPKMEFGFAYTYPADYLQSLPAKQRRDAIRSAVDNLCQPVLAAATSGKAFHLVNVSQYVRDPSKRNGPAVNSYPPPYIVTIDDLLEGFRDKFPGCKVEYTETWEDVRPGVREQRSGILIDWSPPRRNSATLKL